jgi:hypothetical protein
VCASSGQYGECSGEVTLDIALGYCQNTFGPFSRLCSLEELKDDEAKDTGCDYDAELIWSSTMCENGGLWQARGAVLTSGGV